MCCVHLLSDNTNTLCLWYSTVAYLLICLMEFQCHSDINERFFFGITMLNILNLTPNENMWCITRIAVENQPSIPLKHS